MDHGSYCGPPKLLSRSYQLPSAYPFQDGIRLVMEQQPGACDLYPRHVDCDAPHGCGRFHTFCERMAAGLSFEPEWHVREVIASFLVGCDQPGRRHHPCWAMDLGANNGWFSLMMLSLGAHVTSVEAQPDLAAALNESVQLNCWSWRANVHNAYVIAERPEMINRSALERQFWRAGNEFRSGNTGVPLVMIDELLCGRRAMIAEWTLIKLDADGPEGSWLERIEQLLGLGRVRVRTIVVECNGCDAELMHRMQSVHGYDIYQLDMHIDKRFLDAKGHDVYSRYKKDCGFFTRCHLCEPHKSGEGGTCACAVTLDQLMGHSQTDLPHHL